MTRSPAGFYILLPLAAASALAAAPGKSIDDGSHGARVYMRNCASCHMTDGAGVPSLQPSLIGDPVIDRASPRLLIDVILRGPAAVLPPNRPHYGNIMTPFPSLSDRDVATLATFLRRTLAHDPTPVTPAQVEAERGP